MLPSSRLYTTLSPLSLSLSLFTIQDTHSHSTCACSGAGVTNTHIIAHYHAGTHTHKLSTRSQTHIMQPLFSFYRWCYLSLIGSVKTKAAALDAPLQRCSLSLRGKLSAVSTHTDSHTHTHTEALDMPDLCAVWRRPVTDYTAQFQGLHWISERASLQSDFKAQREKHPVGCQECSDQQRSRELSSQTELGGWASDTRYKVHCFAEPFFSLAQHYTTRAL